MRIGFFGGTFDPPHNGHLAVARVAVREFALDRLLLVPTGRQPLKAVTPVATYADRLAMVGLLCEGVKALEASDLEKPDENSAANFTVETLSKLRTQLTAADEMFVVVGADAFLGLRKWREPDELLSLAQWIVVSRPGFNLSDLATVALTPQQRERVHVLENVAVPISATELRRKLLSGEDCSSSMPESVWQYIQERKLYQSTGI